MKHGQLAWQAVQANPFGWIDVALGLRSADIFCEAAIHLVGRWNSLTTDEKGGLDPEILVFCESKFSQLQSLLMQTECKIVKFYPKEVKRSNTATGKEIERTSYANDIYHWMALNVFRHWFASAVIVGENRMAEDSGFSLYKKLSLAGKHYLTKEEANQFHAICPMSRRGEHALDAILERLKDGIRRLVVDVMKSETKLDVSKFPVDYLTCTKIDEDEVREILGAREIAAVEEYAVHSSEAGVKRKEREMERQADEKIRDRDSSSADDMFPPVKARRKQ